MATFENSSAGGNWNATASWLENGGAATKTPTASDVVKLVAGGSITVTESASCKEFEATAAFVKTFKLNAAVVLQVNTGWIWSAGGSAFVQPTTAEVFLQLPVSATAKFTPGGATYGIIKVGNLESNHAGTLELTETLKAKNLNVTEGALVTNGHELELSGELKSEPQSGRVAELTLGSSTIRLTGTAQVWLLSNAALSSVVTLNAGTSVIEITNATETEKRFLGGGFTYNNLTIASDNVAFLGSSTFNILKFETAGKTKGTKFTKETTQTISGLEVNGKAGSKVKLLSITAGKEWKLHKVSGNVNVDFIEVSDSHVDASPKWFGGPATDSTYGTGNLNWLEEKENPGFMANTGETTTKIVKFKASGAFTVPGPLQGSTKTQFSAKSSETSKAGISAKTTLAFPDHLGTPTVNAALAATALMDFLSAAPLHASAQVAAITKVIFTTKAPFGGVAPLVAVAPVLRFTTKAPVSAGGKLVVSTAVLFPLKGKLTESGTGKLGATTKIQFSTVAVLSSVSRLTSSAVVRFGVSAQATSRLGAIGSSLVQFHTAAPLTSAARIAGISNVVFPSRISGYVAAVLLGGQSVVRFEETAQPSAVALLEGDAAAAFTTSAHLSSFAGLRAFTKVLFIVKAAPTAIGEPGTVLLFDAPMGRVELYDAL